MVEVYLWAYDGGAWSDPGLWRVADVVGLDSGFPRLNPAIPSREAERAPGPEDTVVFANFTNPAPPPTGPLTGGGEAAAVYTQPDFSPVPLFGDPADGLDVYRFGEVHLNDRILFMQGAILETDRLEIDGSSRLDLDQAAMATDAAGRPYSARVGTLDLAAGSGNGPLGQVNLGPNNLIAEEFINANGGLTNVTGTGAILPAEAEPPPPTPDWDALAAAVQANFAATGQWFVPDGPVFDPETTDWDALAAQATANFAATGQWYL
jgi:hypothetical protein